MLISLQDVTKSYSGRTLFNSLSFNINYNERVGLVGTNGSGKTTLLKLIAGIEEPDNGKIQRKKSLRIGFVEQINNFEKEQNVYDFVYSGNLSIVEIEGEIKNIEQGLIKDPLHISEIFEKYRKIEGFKYRARVEEVIKGLGIGHLKQKIISELSGGELKRVLLARVILSDAELFLFDEPTNHLDIYTVKWFRDHLISMTKPFVIVTHDAYLLDGCVKKIIELNNGKAFFFSGDYEFYQKKKEELQRKANREYKNKVEKIKKDMEFVRKNLGSQKTNQAKSRLKMIEKIKLDDPQPFKNIRLNLTFKEPLKKSRNILKCTNLSVGYGTPVVKGIDILVLRGEKYAVVGRNGSGKSTFIKTLIGETRPITGEVKVFPNIKVGFFPQEVVFKNEESRVFEIINQIDPFLNRESVLNYLARFYFRKEMVEKRVKFLSGGERSRLKLAELLLEDYDLLLLDEPTNHLDLSLTNSLSYALENFSGSVIVVSHNIHFLDRIANKVIEFSDGKMRLFDGGISYYFEKISKENGEGLKTAIKAKKDIVSKDRKVRKKSGISKNELLRAKWRLKEVEEEIESLEREKEELENSLYSKDIINNYIKLKEVSDKIKTIETKIERLLEEWERLSKICT